jgi:WD40 repeat protein/tRNA A-37 threonylcarbamoyl transferase component Bud32
MGAICDACGVELVMRGPRLFCPSCVIKGLFEEAAEEDTEILRLLANVESEAEVALIDDSLPAVPRHQVVELLGEGGFARVYRAMQLEPVRRMVAVKVLKDEVVSQHALTRFELERQTLARMEHPAIARLFDAGQTTSGQPFFAMELVPGEPLTAFCKRQSLVLVERLRLFVQICHGVQHAHEKGVLHRDLKPSNLLVTRLGSNLQVKVIDFGIAKALEVLPEANAATTAVHQAIGTPGYMSPEQSQWGANGVDARSDIYALGVVLYELITGYTPLQVEQRQSEEALRRHTAWHILPPSRVGGTLQMGNHEVRDLDAICTKALSQEPALRYPSAAALGEDVARHLSDEPVAAVQHSWRYVIDKFTLRHKALVIGTSATLAAILIGFTASLLLYFQAEEQRTMAESREVEVRRSLGMSYFREAQRLKAEGDPHSAVACLGRALQSDPLLDVAANDLQMLMAYGDFLQPRAPRLPIQKELGGIRAAAVSADGETVALAYRKDQVKMLMVHEFKSGVWASTKVPCSGVQRLLCSTLSGEFLAWVEDEEKVLMLDLKADSKTQEWMAPARVEAVTLDNRYNSALVGLQNGEVWRVSGNGAAVLIGKATGRVRHILFSSQQGVTLGTSKGEVIHLMPESVSLSGKLLMRLSGEVTALNSHADSMGQHVVAGDVEGNVGWVSLRGPNVIKQSVVSQLHQGRVTCVTVAQGMRSIFSAGGAEDLRVRWTDAETLQDKATPLETAGLVYRIIAEEDDKAIILSGDSSLRVWNRGQNIATLLRRPQQSKQLATSTMGRTLLAENSDYVEVLNMVCHAASHLLLHPGVTVKGLHPMRRLVLSSDGSQMLLADGFGGAFLWDTATGNYLLGKWKKAAYDMVCSDQNTYIVAAKDGSVLSVPRNEEQPQLLMQGSVEGVFQGRILNAAARQPTDWEVAALCPSGKAAVWAQLQGKRSSDEVCEMRVADLPAGKVWRYQFNRVSAVAVNHASQKLAQGLRIGLLRVVTLGQHVVETETHHQSSITSLHFSKDGKLLISGSTDGTIVLWDVVPRLRMRGAVRCGAAVRSVCLSGDGSRFVACTDHSLHVGVTATLSLLGQSVQLDEFSGACSLDEDGSTCAVAVGSGASLVLDLPKIKSAPPAWFHPFASALVAREITEEGVIETRPTAVFTDLHASVPKVGDDWVSFAKWMLSSAHERPLTPWRKMMPLEYYNQLIKRAGEVNRLEQRRIMPMVGPANRRAIGR